MDLRGNHHKRNTVDSPLTSHAQQNCRRTGFTPTTDLHWRKWKTYLPGSPGALRTPARTAGEDRGSSPLWKQPFGRKAGQEFQKEGELRTSWDPGISIPMLISAWPTGVGN